MRRPTFVRLATMTLLSATLAACGDDSSEDMGVQPDAGRVDSGSPDTGRPALASLVVEPTMFSLAVGETQGLAVTAMFSDGSTELITTEGTFVSVDQTVATVDESGTVTGVGPGSTSIVVTFGGEGVVTMVSVDGDPPPPPPPPPGNAFVVFGDDYAPEVSFEEFGGSANNISVDTNEAQEGDASLRVEVPADGYTGGAMVIATPQDLTSYDALTFWARSSVAATLNVSGIQNDAMASAYAAERVDVSLTTTWTKYVIPIPNPSRLTAERGLFHFAEGSEEGAYTVWFDLIQYETLGRGPHERQARHPRRDPQPGRRLDGRRRGPHRHGLRGGHGCLGQRLAGELRLHLFQRQRRHGGRKRNHHRRCAGKRDDHRHPR